MKKIVGTIAAIALASSVAFAEVNVGMGFNRGFFTPFAYDNNAKTGIATSWGAQPRVGISFSASSDQVGVAADVKFDGGSVAVNDNAYIWVKPASWFTLKIGQTFDDTLRGNACFGLWDWLRPGNILGEDLTFVRICDNPLSGAYAPVQGAILMLDPVEGLHIAAALNTGYGSDTWENVAKKLQVQAGYTIADILQIKAQWIGTGVNADNQIQGVINAAVSLKAVENMTLDAAVFFNTKSGEAITVAAFWEMPISAIKLDVNAEVKIPTASSDKLSMKAGVGFSVDCGNGIGVAADVRFGQKFADGEKAKITASAMVNKGLASGSVGVGVQAAFNEEFGGITGMGVSDMNIAVPVMIQCFF